MPSPPLCPNCGARQRRPDARFCQNCGYPLNSTPTGGDSAAARAIHSKIWLWIGGALLVALALLGLLLFGPGRKLLPCCQPPQKQPVVIATHTPLPTSEPTEIAESASPTTPPPPTATPLSTHTPAPPPTATPAPTATSAPTATPVPPATSTPPPPPTNTPIPAPTATPACQLAVDGRFRSLYQRQQLGCPTNAARITWAAWEPYQGGAMLWRDDVNAVTVFYSGAGWSTLPDQWHGEPTPSRGNPPAGLRQPVRGFGWIWGNHDEVFNGLGWATDEEKGVCLIVQDFQKGFILLKDNTPYCNDRSGNSNYNRAAELPNIFIAAHDNGRAWRMY